MGRFGEVLRRFSEGNSRLHMCIYIYIYTYMCVYIYVVYIYIHTHIYVDFPLVVLIPVLGEAREAKPWRAFLRYVFQKALFCDDSSVEDVLGFLGQDLGLSWGGFPPS